MTETAGNNEHARRLPGWFGKAVPVLATLALLVGIVLMLLPAEQISAGWFAYAPLPQTIFVPDAGLLSPRRLFGAVLAALGGLTLAFCAGWAIAQRSHSSKS